MGRPARWKAWAAIAGAFLGLTACGSTITSVGSVPGDDGTDATTPATEDASDGSATSKDGAPDGHPCPTSQCADVDGGVLCEGAHGRRLCTGSMHTEACTCGGTAPSHWIDCGGCP